MAHEIHRNGHPGIALATIPPFTSVRFAPTGSQDRAVVAVASQNQRADGVVGQKWANPGDAITVYLDGSVVKARANASLGVGAEVAIASGAATGFQPVAAASGVVVHSAGIAQSAAAAGEFFSFLVRTRQLGGMP